MDQVLASVEVSNNKVQSSRMAPLCSIDQALTTIKEAAVPLQTQDQLEVEH